MSRDPCAVEYKKIVEYHTSDWHSADV